MRTFLTLTKNRRLFIRLLIFFLSLFFIIGYPLSSSAVAGIRPHSPYVDDIDYDSVDEKLKPTFSDKLGELPAAPFDLTKTVLENLFVFIEKYHIDKKLIHGYETLTGHGIYPKVHSFGGKDAGFGGGVEIKRDLFSGGRVFDKLNFRGWAYNSVKLYQRYGAEATFRDVLGSGISAYSNVDYKNYASEDFFGVGPRTSLGDGVDFRYENLTAAAGGRAKFPWNLSGDAMLGYSRTMIFEGAGNKQDIKRYYSERTLPGLNGADQYFIGADIMHDTRDNEGSPTTGGYERFSVSFRESVAGDRFKYIRYKADLARFIPVFGPKRVIALHALFEFNDNFSGHEVPFFDLARVGGYKSLRGYQFNRFFGAGRVAFHAEYRYQIWNYKAYALDTIPFFEMGEVFEEVGKFKGGYLRYSYGLSFRVKYKNKVASVDGAHSSEGTYFYVGFGAPF